MQLHQSLIIIYTFLTAMIMFLPNLRSSVLGLGNMTVARW